MSGLQISHFYANPLSALINASKIIISSSYWLLWCPVVHSARKLVLEFCFKLQAPGFLYLNFRLVVCLMTSILGRIQKVNWNIYPAFFLLFFFLVGWEMTSIQLSTFLSWSQKINILINAEIKQINKKNAKVVWKIKIQKYKIVI